MGRPRIPGVGERRRPAPRVFISYRREDAAAYAGRLYDVLAARFGEANVFMDVDTIALGSDFTDAIDRALASCDAAIALIGRDWATAADGEGRRRLDDPEDVLRLELERALAQGLVLIPALVRGAGLPRTDELPDTLEPLVRRQGIELRDNAWHDDVARLARQLEGLTGAAPAEGNGTSTSPRRRGRWRWLAAAGAAVAGLAVALAFVLGGDGADGGGGGATATGQDRLLAVIPPAIRPSCDAIDYGPESAAVSVSCSGAGLGVSYYLFENQSVLDAWYELKREEAGIDPDTGACDAGTFRGESPYTVDGEDVGRSYCLVDDEENPNRIWTDARATVGAEAGLWAKTGPPAVESLLRQWDCCLQLEP